MDKIDDLFCEDIYAAAVRFYEIQKFDMAIPLLKFLLENDYNMALVLYGHCIFEGDSEDKLKNAELMYKKSCEIGYAVGCYNVYLINKENGDLKEANKFRKMALDLGFTE